MPRLPTRARIRSIALLVGVLTITTFLPPGIAQADAATHLLLEDVSPAMTAVRDVDEFTISGRDDADLIDTGYAGTVTFSANCDDVVTDCVEISLTQAPFAALPGDQYTFVPLDAGTKTLYLRWTTEGIGAQTMDATADDIAVEGDFAEVMVTSNAATQIELTEVDDTAQVNVPDTVQVNLRNANGQTGADYTGVVTFASSCGDECFAVSPNNGGADAKKYTFVAGDAGTKDFDITWSPVALSPPDRSLTVSGADLSETPAATQEGITVAEDPASTTTTSTTTTTTTTTTVPTTTTSTSTTTTSTSTTTTTTAAPRTPAAQIVTGAGAGGGPHVIVRTASDPTSILYSFYAYDPGFLGGVRVATGDVNGDGYDDIITSPGPGGGPHIQVFSGKDGFTILGSFYAYAPEFTGGVFVAAGDVNGDGKADVITGADAGGGPHVRVFDGTQLGNIETAEVLGLFGYGPTFTGGVRVGAGDFNNDNKADIVTGPGPGGGPHVRIFSGADGGELSAFMAYPTAFTGGVFVASGEGDKPLVFTGAGPGGGRHVRALDQQGLESLGFMAGPGTEGAIPAVGEANSAANDFFFVSRATGNAGVQRFDFENGNEISASAFAAYAAEVGVFIAVGVL